MKSFSQHTTEHELDRDQLDEDLYKKVKIDEATGGDFLLGLGAAGGLLAMKKAWDVFGKGTKLQKKLHALNPFQTQADKAAVAKDIEDRRKSDVDNAKTILDDPDASEKDKAKAQKTLDKKQTGDEKEAQATADKEKGEKDRIKRGDLTDVEKAQQKIDKASKKSGEKDTLAKADELDVKSVGDAQKFFDKHGRAPAGYQEYPDDSKKVLDTKTVEKEKEIAAKKKEQELLKKKDKERRARDKAAADAAAAAEKNKTQNTSYKPEGNMTITESNELQAIMALDDAGIKAEINRKGEVVVKKKDLKKAQKALKGSFKKGGEPKLIGEGVLEDGTTEMANQYKNDTPGQAGDDLIKVIEMQMSAAAKKKKDLWKKSAGGKKSLLKSKKRAKKVSSGAIKIDKARGRSMAKARAKGGIRNEFELGEELELNEKEKHAGWIAFYNKDKLEIKNSEADGLYDAKLLAIKHFKVPKSKQGLLAIEPAYEEFEITEALGKLDKSVIDAFYYKKEKAGKVVSSDGDSLYKGGMGAQKIAQWLDPAGKIYISAVTDVKSTESILKYMKKSIPKGNFDKKSYKSFFGEELQRTAYELVSEARKKAAANKPQWEQE